DQRLIIKTWHSQLSLPGGTKVAQRIDGPGAAPAQSSMATAAWEWQFPTIEDAPGSTHVSGSGTTIISGGLIPQQAPANTVPATCSWQFDKSGPTPSSPALMTATP